MSEPIGLIQRRIVLAIKINKKPMTIEEIEKAVNKWLKKEESFSRITIERSIKALTERKVITEIKDDETIKYDLPQKP